MKYYLRHFILGFLLLFLFCSSSHGAQKQALLIGISQYTELDSLRYADADVQAFSQILTDFAGYKKSDVTVLLNQQATKNRIVDEINKTVRTSEKQPIDHFILMFAGHGIPKRINNKETNIFLAPSDASTADNTFYSTGKETVNETFINRAWLARQLSAIKAKSIVIILDSCYSGNKDFGDLFIENEGYTIQSFGSTGPQRGVAVVQKRQGTVLAVRSIAYLASSREDQPSAEYEELHHGALSYCIFENIKRAQRETYADEGKELSVGSVYANIMSLFHEVKVQGRFLDEVHQPFLLPIPDFAGIKDMKFISVQGVKRREIKNGILEIRTDPVGVEISVDGVKREEVTNCRLELPEGKHHIELFLPSTSYRYSFTVDIAASWPVGKTIAMRGVLEVESFWLKDGKKSPGPKLDLYINGTSVGKSQLRLDNLLAGTHLLEVRYENVTKTRHVEIRPDSPLHVNYSVIREAAAPKVKDESGVGNVVF
ncbi:MAG: caspase family protein [Deltaproteobacteria bacterium]|jgi:hypothetical protein|nr:caspase family protein [Deltaproteobacteria bacterium]